MDKPGLTVGGRTLVRSVVRAALDAGAARVVVVGPARPELAGVVEFTREEPPGGGPVPALRAGLELVSEPRVLLLAADLPFLTGALLRELAGAADGPRAGVVLADDQGEPQWLTSCWASAALRAALAEYTASSLRGLLAPLPHTVLTPATAPGTPPGWLDCDTPEDLAAATQWASERGP